MPTPTHPPRTDDGLADFLPDALLLTDIEGRIREANAATSALIGYARNYALGKPVTALLHPSAVAVMRMRIEQAAASDRLHEFETLLRPARAGTPRDAHVWLAPLRDADGTLVGLRWLLRDVTEQKATAARLAHLETAHRQELRTATMELEATCRMLQAQLAATPGAAPARVTAGVG